MRASLAMRTQGIVANCFSITSTIHLSCVVQGTKQSVSRQYPGNQRCSLLHNVIIGSKTVCVVTYMDENMVHVALIISSYRIMTNVQYIAHLIAGDRILNLIKGTCTVEGLNQHGRPNVA